MTEQKEFVDFNIGLGDSGEDNLSAIQPLSDGEGATQIQFRRPSENLRERTETLRDSVGELLYYRDYSHLMIEYTGGTITWNGPAPGASPLGQITVTAGSFTLAPMLAPYQAKKGVLNVGTVSSNRLIYTVANAAYATHGMNAVTVKHLDVTGTVTVGVTISDGPVKRIVVTFDSLNSGHDAFVVQTALSAAIAGDTALAGRLVITTSALVSVAIAAVAETRLDTTADDEKHVVSGADIQALTVTTPLQPGMGIAIWYKYLIEPTGFGADPKGGLAGGRAESSGDRGTSAIPSAALFVTHVSPEKIPGAIPICRVGYNGQLIWYDGTRVQAGETITFASPTSVAAANLAALALTLSTPATGAAYIGYNGSGPWKDGNPLSAVTVEAALDEIVADLADDTNGSSGARRIGYSGTGSLWADGQPLAATSVEQALDEIVTDIGDATVTSGASKVGVYVTPFVAPAGGAITAIGGGGLTATADDLQTALNQTSAQLVARRAYTAVVTDTVNSAGGDIDSITPMPAMSANFGTGGTFFFRRGSYNIATSPTLGNNYSLVGEYGSEAVVLTNTAGVAVPFDLANSIGVNRFENISFHTASGSPGYFEFRDGGHGIRNCRANPGVLQFSPDSFGLRLSIDSLMIFGDDDLAQRDVSLSMTNTGGTREISGTVHEIRMSTVPSWNNASQAKYGIRMKDLITSTGIPIYEALVIQSCYLSIDTGFGAAGGAILRIENCHQPIIFKGCFFRNAEVTSIAKVLQITDSSGITFEDCTFVQGGTASAVLSITGNSNDIHFLNCKFYTSDTAQASEEFHVISDGSDDVSPITFTNCSVNLRYGGSNQLFRISFNRTNNIDVGTAGILLNGFKVYLSYTNSVYMNPRFFMFSSGATGSRGRFVARDISFHLNSKRLAIAGTPLAILFSGSGSDTGFVHVENLTLLDITEPHDSASTDDTNILVYLDKAGVNGGATYGASTINNDVGFAALFLLTASAYVRNVNFSANDNVVRGRLLQITGNNCKVQDCTVNVTNLHSAQALGGWFCEVTASRNVVTANTVYVSTGTGGLTNANLDDALILLDPSAAYSVIANNVMRTGTGIAAIGLNETDFCTVTANTHVGEYASDLHSIIIASPNSQYNIITGNVSRNVGSSTTSLAVYPAAVATNILTPNISSP